MSTINTTNIRYINLTTGNSLASYIAETCLRANKLKDRIQIAAVGILSHVGMHNNKPQAAKFANDLITGLGQGIQTQALIDWFLEFGFKVNEEGKALADDIDLDLLKVKFQEAKKTHWVTFAPAPIFKGYDDDTQLEAYIKQATKAADLKQTDATKADKITVNANRLAVISVIANMSETQLASFMQSANLTTTTGEEPTVITEDFTADMEEEIAA